MFRIAIELRSGHRLAPSWSLFNMKYKKMDEKRKSELRTATLLIRFRSAKPSKKSKKYVSYKRIASTLNLTENEV